MILVGFNSKPFPWAHSRVDCLVPTPYFCSNQPSLKKYSRMILVRILNNTIPTLLRNAVQFFFISLSNMFFQIILSKSYCFKNFNFWLSFNTDFQNQIKNDVLRGEEYLVAAGFRLGSFAYAFHLQSYSIREEISQLPEGWFFFRFSSLG